MHRSKLRGRRHQIAAMFFGGRIDRALVATLPACQSAAGPNRNADRAMQAGQATLGRAKATRAAGPALSGCLHLCDPMPSSAAQARARRPRQPAEAAAPSNYFLCRGPGAGFAPSCQGDCAIPARQKPEPRLPDASSTSVVRQPSGGSHYWNSGYVQTVGHFKQLGEGAREARAL